MNSAYIGIGSNLGNRHENISSALELMANHSSINVIAKSNWYETPALTKDDQKQSNYLNGAARIGTTLDPIELLDELQSIECKLGRPKNHNVWQPRIIDLDILLYEKLVMKTDRLILPHPEMTKRLFVLKPLCDIAPDLVHPMTGHTVKELMQKCLE
jgi:2-amino-4-hydroxy-6-hydroxymethyldihydropteridine diphosphokinase